MSIEGSTNYCLRVIRAEDLRWQSSSLCRIPDLYVKVKLGNFKRRTRVIKESLSPIWNGSFVFPSSDTSNTLTLKVKHTSGRLKKDHCIGRVDIKLIDLLMKCPPGSEDATLCLSSSDDGSSVSAGRIILHLDVVDEWKGAEIGLAATEEDIRRSKIMRYAGASDVTQVISSRASQLTNQGDLYQAVGVLMSKLGAFKTAMSALSEIHPFLTLAWKLASGLYSTVQGVFERDQRIVDLVRSMSEAFTFVQDVQTLPDKAANLQENIVGLLKQTIECCLFVSRYAGRCFLTRMVDITSGQKIDEFERSLATFKQKIESGIVLYTATIVSMRTPRKIDGLVLRQRLNPSLADAFHRTSCLPNTRVSIRQMIVDWVFREDKQNIFWLHGVAGSGKSTVSTTIAQHFRDMSRLGAFLFFERGKSDPSSVIRTIAYKLALFESSIGGNILSETDTDGDVTSTLPVDQFTKLLLRPLSQTSMEGPVLIVLDALDECGTPETRRPLMQLFRRHFAALPKTFRFLITSRRESDILNVFSSQPEAVREVGLDYTSAASQQDVLTYLREEMWHAVQENVPRGWPWDETIASLGRAAGGLFIWASTAIKMISTSDNPFHDLENLASDSNSITNNGLDVLYATVLRDSGIKWAKEESRTRFLQVFYLILFAKVPLTCEMIDDILGFPPQESADLVLTRLRCLLSYSPGAPVRLFHASLVDFLTSKNQLGEPWAIDVDFAGQLIVQRCFSTMRTLLHFNICKLETSFLRNRDIPDLADRVKVCIPSHLEYVCVHWVDHLCDAPYSPDVVKALSDFAHRDLLFWFEVLSLVKSFGRVANRALSDAAEWINSQDPDLTAFLRDAGDLATTFALPISQNAPHIYITVVPLSKDESIVSSYYSKLMSSMVQVQRMGTSRPFKFMRVLKAHTLGVRSISVSQDGRFIASSGGDRSVRVWDPHNGEELVALEDSVKSVSFFPDGRRLALCSVYDTWKIWDVESGELTLGPSRDGTAGVASITVSPDGTRVALGLDDGAVELFDVLEDKVIARFDGCHGEVISVTFSADGRLLASASYDQIGIWDAKSGDAFGPFEFSGHGVSFSPDGKYIMYVQGESVNVLEVESGHAHVLHHDYYSISIAAFSPCGTRIVVGSTHGAVSVLHATTGEVIFGPFKGHIRDVTSVSFTPDGRQVVSGSIDGNIRILDIRVAHVDSAISVGREDIDLDTFVWDKNIERIAISDDGSRIATASDEEIVIWDAKTGAVVAGPLDNTNSISRTAFSPDNSRLVEASPFTISVWDVETGQLAFDPIECPGRINCLATPPDSTGFTSSLPDEMLEVRRMTVGRSIARPPAGSLAGSITTLKFSPNGSRLASGSRDGNIRIWDTATWEAISCLTPPSTGEAASIRFSPDGTQVSSSSQNGIVTTWDTERGHIIYGPYCTSRNASSLFFTQNGLHVLSRTDGNIENQRPDDGDSRPGCDPLRSPETYPHDYFTALLAPPTAPGSFHASTGKPLGYGIRRIIEIWMIMDG